MNLKIVIKFQVTLRYGEDHEREKWLPRLQKHSPPGQHSQKPRVPVLCCGATCSLHPAQNSRVRCLLRPCWVTEGLPWPAIKDVISDRRHKSSYQNLSTSSDSFLKD